MNPWPYVWILDTSPEVPVYHTVRSFAVDPGRFVAVLGCGRRGEIGAMFDEIDRLRALTDPEITFKEVEMKIRDGVINIHMPFGRSSHAIRLDLEARIEKVRHWIETDAEMHGDTADELLRILEYTPAPPQPPTPTEDSWT